jgi:hypothetical protein
MYLSLTFNISTTHTESLVITGHKDLYALFAEGGHQTDDVD